MAPSETAMRQGWESGGSPPRVTYRKVYAGTAIAGFELGDSEVVPLPQRVAAGQVAAVATASEHEAARR
jgi:hypothetical protein